MKILVTSGFWGQLAGRAAPGPSGAHVPLRPIVSVHVLRCDQVDASDAGSRLNGSGGGTVLGAGSQ